LYLPELALTPKSSKTDIQRTPTYAAKSISALQNIRNPQLVVSTKKAHFSLLVTFATSTLMAIGPLKHTELSVVTSEDIKEMMPSESYGSMRHLGKCGTEQTGDRHFILTHLKRRITVLRSKLPCELFNPLNVSQPLNMHKPLNVHKPLNMHKPLNVHSPLKIAKHSASQN
jgi:hypothetical protein